MRRYFKTDCDYQLFVASTIFSVVAGVLHTAIVAHITGVALSVLVPVSVLGTVLLYPFVIHFARIVLGLCSESTYSEV